MLGLSKLNRFSKRLQDVNSVEEILDLTVRDVRAIGYTKAWLCLPDDVNPHHLRVVTRKPIQPPIVLDIQGDRLIAELMLNGSPIVIEDVKRDPRTNKVLASTLNQRSLVCVPMYPTEDSFAVFGVGTFGDQGYLVPDPNELEYLIAMGHQISIALGRLRYRESRRQNNLRLTKIQKLENLGLLASGVVHEFNNMLTVIGININTAKMYCPEEAVKELEIALEASNRIRDLSRQLMSVGRIDDSRKPLNVNDTVLHIGALLGKISKEIQITLDLDAELPYVMATVEQLNQIVLNLSFNAKDAMSVSGGNLALRTAHLEEEILIEVKDTGSGIPPEVFDRIFEPFFTTKEYKLGSGLGLSVVQGVVESLEGRIECQSQVGIGTTFRVYLPAITVRSPSLSPQ